MNKIELDDEWFELITDDYVDEVILHDYKGQNHGYRIYELTQSDANGYDIPSEYVGSWKGELTWGGMCGIIDKKPLVRVKGETVMVPTKTWEVVND